MVALDPFMLDYLGWMMPLHVLLGVLALWLLLLVGRQPASPGAAAACRCPAARASTPGAGSPPAPCWPRTC